MPNEVVFYHSGETGAPTLNNAAGSMIAVLDACLITGFATTSASAVSVSAGVATLTINGHPYTTGKMVDVAGAAVPAVNGRKPCTVVDANNIRVPAAGAADGAVTGTVTVKRSPLGWAKPYSATGKAIYARTDPAASSMLLRVDDSVAAQHWARVTAVESATGVDAFTGPIPTDAQLSGGQYWWKGNASNTTAKPWVLVGDSRSIWFLTEPHLLPWSTWSALGVQAFGDLISVRAGDAYRAFLLGFPTASAVSEGLLRVNAGALANTPTSMSLVLARRSNGVGGPVRGVYFAPGFVNQRVPGANSDGAAPAPVYPSPVNNGLVLVSPLPVGESPTSSTGASAVRGVFPGMAAPLANVSGARAELHLTEIDGLIGSSRRYLLVAVGQGSSPGSDSLGVAAFDLTGPWQ
jgi:hypothetical protein